MMVRVGGIGGLNPNAKWGAGTPGHPGPPGPPGYDGEDGQEGLSGTSGKDGQPGPIGPTGNIGRIGSPGLDGDDGTDGFAGNPGQQGGQGVAGPQGNPGSIIGQVVVTGPPGYDGNDGDDGFPGMPGSIGPIGPSGSSSVFLGLTAYAAAGDGGLHTVSTNTMTKMDATNAIVTFTAPASGNILVTTSALHDFRTSGDIYWGLIEGTSTVIATQYIISAMSSNGDIRLTAKFYFTGITAGSHTYALAHRISSGSATVYTGPTLGQLIMEVVAN
jgi:Collagen triple helix repeat (20 copies)